MASGRSCKPTQGSPSFFKVLKDPSTPYLSLPPAFVRRHFEKIPENPILKTEAGEHSWRLKIRNIGGKYYFSHGWKKLVKDAQLRRRDFLVFWLIDPSTFHVLIFDAQGCEKDLPPNLTNILSDCSTKTRATLNLKTVIKVEDDEEEAGRGGGGGGVEVIPDENPCFQKVISEKTHRYTMGLPKRFMEVAGIGNKSSIRLKDLEQREWLVGLATEKSRSVKYSLSSGWSRFRQYNKLSEGDVCLFEFIKREGVLTLSQLIKSKVARKQEGPRRKTPVVAGVKRERGRPRLEKPRGRGVKIEDESGVEAEVVTRKRGRPLLEKPRGGGGRGDVKIEEESGPEVEVVVGKRGGSRLKKPCGGGDVKIEDESDPEVVTRKRGGPRLEKPRVGSGGGNVKIGDESGPKVEVQRKRGRPQLAKRGGSGGGGGVVVKIEVESSSDEAEAEARKRGRSCFEGSLRSNRVIYF